MKSEIITSKDNEKIKIIKKLSQKKYRRELDMFKVENFKMIIGAIEAGINLESIYVTDNFIGGNKDFIESLEGHYYVISDVVNKSFSELSTPSGVCAVFKKLKREVIFEAPIVYLNGINDPGNLGTILRSALAFNFSNILVDEECADIYNSKTLQAAKDSIFKLNISFDTDRKLFRIVKEKMKIFSTRAEGARLVEEVKFGKNFCLVLGSEAHGISRDIIEQSDEFVRIGINRESESLNVANAASILFYEINKRN